MQIDIAMCNYNKSISYYKLKKYNEVLEECNKARKIFQKQNLLLNIAVCNQREGLIYCNLKRPEKAIEFLDKARKTFKEYNQNEQYLFPPSLHDWLP
ncbi:MAG: Tetratricopeptide repeat protein [bacterium ADurb.Bin363]|nr:MAG: Tetratricopeptide repeat protein [bacterium ADurb.Bin363]